MAKTTIVFAILLILLGGAGFCVTGCAHPTALIPAAFGLVLLLCGVVARTDDSRKRMLWMHVAVTVGLLGFLGGAIMAAMALVRAHGAPLDHPIAMEEQVAMALLCLVFVGLCVRSFIAARRGRSA